MEAVDRIEMSIKDVVIRSTLNINSKLASMIHESLKKQADLTESLDSISKYKFVLQDNPKLQRAISSIFASSVTEGMIMFNDENIETKIYEYNVETIVENLTFYDLYQEKYELFPLLIDVLGESMIKDIVLNYSTIIKKLENIEKKNTEIKSILRGRSLQILRGV